MRRPICFGLAVFLLLFAAPAHATHFRGLDAWASVDSSGTVTLNVVTRWRKGTVTAPEFEAGVNPDRFGATSFTCEDDGLSRSVNPATGMRIVRVSDGAVVYEWGQTEPIPSTFTLEATTLAVSTMSPTFDSRAQVLQIPLGATSSPSPFQISSPRNLAPGDYDIIWNDWWRVEGIQNLASSDCGSVNGGFGFNIRVRFNPAISRSGPNLDAPFIATVVRGLPYSQNLNVNGFGGPLAYWLVTGGPIYPAFGPTSQIPGLTLDSSGQLTIPAAETNGLLDNSAGVPGADYMLKVRIADSDGFISERDQLLDVAVSSCPSGYAWNGTTCVDIDECALRTDTCDAATTTCTNTPGSFECVCKAGRGDCDGDPKNGCETDLTAPEHCGACSNSCIGLSGDCTNDYCRQTDLTCQKIDRASCSNPDAVQSDPRFCGPEGCGACNFAVSFPGCSNPDTDGDGLSDAWEKAGWIDLNCDGYTNDLPLTSGTGTLAFTADSAVVTGIGTAFVAGPAWIGAEIQIAPGGPRYTVGSVDGPTQLTLLSKASETMTGNSWSVAGPDVRIPDANPKRADVYLKLSWMANSPTEADVAGLPSHKPSQESINWVIAAFAGAHITAPDGQVQCNPGSCPDGLTCSAEDHVCLPICSSDSDCTAGACVSGTCQMRRLHVDPLPAEGVPHHNIVGYGPVPPACVTGEDTTQTINFFDIKASSFDPKRALFTRYGLFGHFQSCDSTGTCNAADCLAPDGVTHPDFSSSGMAEVSGNDFMVTLGAFPTASGPDAAQIKTVRESGAMMHELGHTLGLNHGGPDCDPVLDPITCTYDPHRPFKVNYLSVMNPAYNFGIPVTDPLLSTCTNGLCAPSPLKPLGVLDFSHAAMNDLVEAALDENRGVSPGLPPPYNTYLTKFSTLDRTSRGCAPPNPPCLLTAYGSVASGQGVNWDINNPLGNNGAPVAVDLNNALGATEIFHGADDWNFLHYAFQCSPTFANGAPPPENAITITTNEITVAAASKAGILEPPITTVRLELSHPCVDLSSNGVVPVTLFGSSGFDVTKIDLASVRLGGAPVSSWSLDDKDGDGVLDLKARFRQSEMTLLSAQSSRVILSGRLTDGRLFTSVSPIGVTTGPLGTCGDGLK